MLLFAFFIASKIKSWRIWQTGTTSTTGLKKSVKRRYVTDCVRARISAPTGLLTGTSAAEPQAPHRHRLLSQSPDSIYQIRQDEAKEQRKFDGETARRATLSAGTPALRAHELAFGSGHVTPESMAQTGPREGSLPEHSLSPFGTTPLYLR